MRLVLCAIVAAAILTPSAFAQSKKEMIAKDVQLEQRILNLENRFVTGDPAAERLMQRMDALEAAQRAITGEIEQLRYENAAPSADITALKEKVDAFKALADEMRAHLDSTRYSPPVASTGSVPIGSTNPPIIYDQYNNPISPTPPTNPAYESLPPAFPQSSVPGTLGNATVDSNALKDIGQQKLRSGDFIGAQLAYKQYIDLNPAANDLGDAYFWLGETYYVKSGFAEAAEAYIASMRANAKGDKAPSAMIGLAGSLRGMGNMDGACQTLDSFPIQFPDVSADLNEKADRERQRAGCS